jgi:hypothetical protein
MLISDSGGHANDAAAFGNNQPALSLGDIEDFALGYY